MENMLGCPLKINVSRSGRLRLFNTYSPSNNKLPLSVCKYMHSRPHSSGHKSTGKQIHISNFLEEIEASTEGKERRRHPKRKADQETDENPASIYI